MSRTADITTQLFLAPTIHQHHVRPRKSLTIGPSIVCKPWTMMTDCIPIGRFAIFFFFFPQTSGNPVVVICSHTPR